MQSNRMKPIRRFKESMKRETPVFEWIEKEVEKTKENLLDTLDDQRKEVHYDQ